MSTGSILQSRTPALIFEHVNNTDFKVGTELHPSSQHVVCEIVHTSFLGILVVFLYTCVYVMEGDKSPVLCLRCQKVNRFLVLSSVTGTVPRSGAVWCLSGL